MKSTEYYDKHEAQKLTNKQIENRGCVAVTLKAGESLELSNGITVIFRKKRSANAGTFIIIAPKDVIVHRGPE